MKNSSCLSLLIFFAAVCFLALPAQAQTGQIVGLGDKCVDVFQASADDGTPVVLWQCSGNANQSWQFTTGAEGLEIVGLGGQCLLPGPVGESGFPEMEIGPCGTTETTWSVNGSLGGIFKLIHESSGLCLDVLGSQTADGTPLIAFDCRDQVNQEWRLVGEGSLPAYVVPYYEFDNQFFPLTTLFAVRNPGSEPVSVRYQYFRDDEGPGDLVVSETRTLGARAVRTVDIRSVSGVFDQRGWIGITAVDASTGAPLAVQDLYGDYFRVDQWDNFATGEKLLATEDALCNNWHVRFLNGGDFNGGTRFRFLVPEFSGGLWTATARVYDEPGNLIQTFDVSSALHSTERTVGGLPLVTNFGTIEWTFGDNVRGYMSVVMDALGRFSVGFEAECRD